MPAMATREIVTLVCDGCGGTEGDGETKDIGTHRVGLDRRKERRELCEECLAFVRRVVAGG